MIKEMIKKAAEGIDLTYDEAATTAAPTALSRRYADASAAAGWRTSWRRRSFSRRTA